MFRTNIVISEDGVICNGHDEDGKEKGCKTPLERSESVMTQDRKPDGVPAMRRVASCPEQPSTEPKPNPVHDVCDIKVKIADLGNACWVVSLNYLKENYYSRNYIKKKFLFILFFLSGPSLYRRHSDQTV